MNQFGRDIRYVYEMRRIGYPLIGIYRNMKMWK